MPTTSFKIELENGSAISALWQAPKKAQACLVLAHGAGAGMTHRAMAAIADGLEKRGIATLRYQFPYMERGSKRVDPPKVAHAAVRAAVTAAVERAKGMALFAGGKSFGGRMTSQVQALAPLPSVKGLVFFGYPLHPAGAPSVERAKHLDDVRIPMLFLQGTKDALAKTSLLKKTVKGLGKRATLELFDAADHSFHVAAKTGRKDSDVLDEILDKATAWMTTVTSR